SKLPPLGRRQLLYPLEQPHKFVSVHNAPANLFEDAAKPASFRTPSEGDKRTILEAHPLSDSPYLSSQPSLNQAA
ncbi:MAG: hypothetical protein MUC70_03085, partial [Bacteroidales bacterium]|nr:hypothetical protein [Bacteroidales bacterium]